MRLFDFRSKHETLAHFEEIKNFPQKMGFVTFILIEPWLYAKNQKKVIDQYLGITLQTGWRTERAENIGPVGRIGSPITD